MNKWFSVIVIILLSSHTHASLSAKDCSMASNDTNYSYHKRLIKNSNNFQDISKLYTTVCNNMSTEDLFAADKQAIEAIDEVINQLKVENPEYLNVNCVPAPDVDNGFSNLPFYKRATLTSICYAELDKEKEDFIKVDMLITFKKDRRFTSYDFKLLNVKTKFISKKDIAELDAKFTYRDLHR